MIYHGYENGYRALGRQTLLEPMEWTNDGWFRALGGDLSRPLPKPKDGVRGPAGFALSDDFSTNRFGVQWTFHDPAADEMTRVRYGVKRLQIVGRGTSPVDSRPLTCTAGDRAYEVEVTMTLTGKGEGGMLLFYSPKAFVGIGFSPEDVKTFQYAEEQPWARNQRPTSRVIIRMTNDDHVVTFPYSHDDGKTWSLHDTRMEVSGIHHNVFGGFLSLKVGLYSAGEGSATFTDFKYRALA
jgi:xylan 1,4-beta-xylosidase